MTQKNRVNKSVFVFIFRAISLAGPKPGNRAWYQIGRMRQNGKLICHVSLGWRGRARFNPNLSPRTFFWPLALLSARGHYSISLTRNGTVCEQGNSARRNFQNIPTKGFFTRDFFAFLGKRKQRFMQKGPLMRRWYRRGISMSIKWWKKTLPPLSRVPFICTFSHNWGLLPEIRGLPVLSFPTHNFSCAGNYSE